jgi:hypothetical protein
MENLGVPYEFPTSDLHSKGPVLNDFYADPEDTNRGVALEQTFCLDDATPGGSELQWLSNPLDSRLSRELPELCPAREQDPDCPSSLRDNKIHTSDTNNFSFGETILRRSRKRPTFILDDGISGMSELQGVCNPCKSMLPSTFPELIPARQEEDSDWPSSLPNYKIQNYKSNSSAFEQTRFREPTEAPSLPEEQEMDLSNTTLSVMPFEKGVVQTSAELGNALLDFLQTEVISAIDKVKPSNFWIRSRVFIKTGPRAVQHTICFLKIRIYKAAVNQKSFFVEFARRSGDALVFSTIFGQASRYLQKRMDVTTVSGNVIPPAMGGMHIVPLFPIEPVKATVLTPLLDMAAMTSQPSLQAEAAATLADIIEQGKEGEVIDKSVAESLCTDRVFQAVRKLICASDIGVLYPLARFLLLICSGSAKADGFLAKDGLLEEILRKTFGIGNSFVVAKEMSRILSISLPRCTHMLAQNAACSLHEQLSIAANMATGEEVQTNLREAARACK